MMHLQKLSSRQRHCKAAPALRQILNGDLSPTVLKDLIAQGKAESVSLLFVRIVCLVKFPENMLMLRFGDPRAFVADGKHIPTVGLL